MGISRFTAMELFTNPHDLHIKVERREGRARFSICISRGPDHRFKPMLTSESFTADFDEAVLAVERILRGVYEFMHSELALPKPAFDHERELENARVLDLELITWILEQIRLCGVAKTYEMPA